MCVCLSESKVVKGRHLQDCIQMWVDLTARRPLSSFPMANKKKNDLCSSLSASLHYRKMVHLGTLIKYICCPYKKKRQTYKGQCNVLTEANIGDAPAS